MLVVCQIFSSYNFHWTAEFAPREDSAAVSHFERAGSQDANDPTHLINSDFKYSQQNDIVVPMDESLESDWARKVVSFSLVIFQVQIYNSLFKCMLKRSWHNLEHFWERQIPRTTLFISLVVIDLFVLLSKAPILKAVA